MATNVRLDEDTNGINVDQTMYRGMIRSLLYLIASRPNIAFSIGIVFKPLVDQMLWIKHQLRDFGIKFNCVPIISAICISKDFVHHSRVKHRHIRHHFLKDNVENKKMSVKHVNTNEQIADIMTKPLPREQHEKMRLELGMIKHSSSTKVYDKHSPKSKIKIGRVVSSTKILIEILIIERLRYAVI